ncbi:cobalamin-dependent protein [Pelagibacteraceae bacterium]|nr:cobalamin-dependent protein [Pelagibacteraceae bacterium]
MKKIKILFCDPRHETVGTHSSYVPINIAYIAAYVKHNIKDYQLEIELTTTVKEVFPLLENWKPDIIGVSNYVWNSGLANTICKYAKKLNPNTLTVLGGPEFPAGTGAIRIDNTPKDATYDKCFNYLTERPDVDYFAYSDGEVAFLEVIENFIKKNFLVKALKANDTPLNGCASISNDGKKLLSGKYIPRIGMEGGIKADGRDVIPSIYTSGMLDKYLDGNYIPSFETARGCPYLCTFCDQGLDASKITAFSTNRLAEEMMYVGEKISKIEGGTKSVAIFDSNWGLFQKDVDLAPRILEVINKYDWPQYIDCSAPKEKRENIIAINDKLKNRVQLGLAMQSLNNETLKDIKRKNWGRERYIEFIREIEKRGKSNTCEQIIPLPNETEETYYDGIKFLMDNNVKTQTYTLMLIVGTELGRDESARVNEIKAKFRILPKQFGQYNGERVFEIEKVCVGTKTMSYQSYLNCRNYSFIVKLLGQPVFTPIYKLTQKIGISWYDFSRSVTKTVEDNDHKSKLKSLYEEFCYESHNELFETEKEAKDFYSLEENYQKLIRGEMGENLLGKYSAKGLLFYNDVLVTLFEVIKKKFSNHLNPEINLILESSEKWLKNIYTIDEIFSDEDEIKDNKPYNVDINFDLPSWLKNSDEPLAMFNGKTTYKLEYNLDNIYYLRNEMKSIYANDKERAFNRYLMHHGMEKGSGLLERKFLKVLQ